MKYAMRSIVSIHVHPLWLDKMKSFPSTIELQINTPTTHTDQEPGPRTSWFNSLYRLRLAVWLLTFLIYFFCTFFSQQNKSIPWMSVLTSVPVLALTVTHFGQNFGYFMLLTQLPSYLEKTLHYDIKQVRQRTFIKTLINFTDRQNFIS